MSYYASKRDVYIFYKLILAFDAPTIQVFAYRSGLFVNGTDAQESVAGHIAELEMSVVFFGVFLRAVRVGFV